MTMTESNPQTKTLMIIMPLFIGWISLNFPAGLVLYWVTMNIVQIVQQWWLSHNEEPKESKEAAWVAKVIEKSAKTVEDALKAALEELNVSEKDIDYEIIEEPSRGFLGLIGTKLAKIKVTVKENIQNVNNDKYNVKNIENIAQKVDSTDTEENKINDLVEEVNASNSKNLDEDEDNNYSNQINEKKIDTAKQFLQKVLSNMKLNVKIEGVSSEEGYIFNLYGENLGILIGKHGQTLDALQYILNLAVNQNDTQRTRFIIDVENYRNRRAETLQNLAKNLAERAIRMNQDVRLEPMNRHERKVIHSSLQDNYKVVTHSAGEEPYRYIIISPKKYGKSKYNKD